MATTDDDGKPVTCAIDIMDFEADGLYFLTAKGKSLYSRLKTRPYVALTGIKGESTMTRIAVSVRGAVRECDRQKLLLLLEKNPYMYEIYPTGVSRKNLTAFILYRGSGEWFSLSKKPIERFAFSFGETVMPNGRYVITEKCIGCGKCLAVCPQSCIEAETLPASILQEHCLNCGYCYDVCPARAVEWR